MNDSMTDLCYAGASEQARAVGAGEVSAAALIDATLSRIEAMNPSINAYRAVLGDRAREEAAAIDAGPIDATKPLIGVPVAIKDTVDVAGETTTWGSNANPTPVVADAPIVTALREAGAIIVGKTTCSELAALPFTETEAWGRTRNPWNTEFSPGGSSGGSAAAVAAGLCGLALGSDGLGSIRAPSSFTGLFGLKPSRDLVWHKSDNWHGLSVNGPIARTVADAATFLDATVTEARPTPYRDAVSGPPPAGLRIAVAWHSTARFALFPQLGAAQRKAVTDTMALLESLGHTVVERELSFSRYAANSISTRYSAGLATGQSLVEHPDRLSKRTRVLAGYGRRIPATYLKHTLAHEPAIAAAVTRVFDTADVVMTPGAVQPPQPIGHLDGKGAMYTLCSSGRIIPHYGIWNVIGHPAASVPAGFDERGLPVSVQLAGRMRDEATLLSLAAQLETTRPWADRRPPFG